jgi:hypothetical protein
MKKIIITVLTLIFLIGPSNADKINQFYEMMKFKKVKFIFKDSPSDDFWNWIDINLNAIVGDQISYGSRKHGEKINLMVIRGLKSKFSMNKEQSLSEAINESLLYFRCVAILKNDSFVVIPDSLKLEFKSYKLISGRIYKGL